MLPSVEPGKSPRYRMLLLEQNGIDRHETPSRREPLCSERERFLRCRIIDVMQHPLEHDEIELPADRVTNFRDRASMQLDLREASSCIFDIGAVGFDPDIRECLQRLVPGIERRRSAPDIEDAERPTPELRVELVAQPSCHITTADACLEQGVDKREFQNAMQPSPLGHDLFLVRNDENPTRCTRRQPPPQRPTTRTLQPSLESGSRTPSFP